MMICTADSGKFLSVEICLLVSIQIQGIIKLGGMDETIGSQYSIMPLEVTHT